LRKSPASPSSRGGLVVQVFGALPVRLRGSFGLFAPGFEIHLPGEFAFHAVGKVVGFAAPPVLLGLEFFQPDGLGLGIALVARRVGVLVEPDGVGVEVLGAVVHRGALGEEQQVGLDGGVGREHALGQADDGVQLAVAQQQFLQRAFDAIAKQKAIGQHHGGAAVFFQQLLDDERHEHVGGFAGAQVGRVVAADAIIFVAAKGRVGDDAIDLVVGAPFVPADAQRVAVLDLAGHVDAVQQHVGGAQQVGQLLFSMPWISSSMARLSSALDLVVSWLRKWSMAAVRKPPVPQAGSITVSRLSRRGLTCGRP
jgi:hypothetical protein